MLERLLEICFSLGVIIHFYHSLHSIISVNAFVNATFSYLIVLTGEEWKRELMFNVHIHDVYIPVGVQLCHQSMLSFPLAERQSAQLSLTYTFNF